MAHSAAIREKNYFSDFLFFKYRQSVRGSDECRSTINIKQQRKVNVKAQQSWNTSSDETFGAGLQEVMRGGQGISQNNTLLLAVTLLLVT